MPIEKFYWGGHRQHRAQPPDHLNDGAHGRRQNNDLAPLGCLYWMRVAFIDRSPFARPLQYRRPVTTHDSPGKPVLLQGQRQRAAYQAAADDRDLPDRHAERSLAEEL